IIFIIFIILIIFIALIIFIILFYRFVYHDHLILRLHLSRFASFFSCSHHDYLLFLLFFLVTMMRMLMRMTIMTMTIMTMTIMTMKMMRMMTKWGDIRQ